MSDEFIREVDEDVREEYMRTLWKKFGPYIIAVAFLIVLVTAGYQAWTYWNKTQSEKSGDTLLKAIELEDKKESEQATMLLNELVESGYGGYPSLARFRLATGKAEAGKVDEAIADFKDLSLDTSLSKTDRDLAALRMGLLSLGKTPGLEMEATLAELLSEASAFRHSAREIVGLAYYQDQAYEKAAEWFDKVLSDQETPANIRQRVGQYNSLLQAQGIALPEESDAEKSATDDGLEAQDKSSESEGAASTNDESATSSQSTD